MEDSPVKPKTINPFKQYLIVPIPQGVASYRGISPGAKLVYGRLQRYAGKKGVAFPNIPDLAEEVGLGERQTREYIAELVRENFILKERVFGQGNVYSFLEHPCLIGTEIGLPRTNSGSFPNRRDTAEQTNRRDTADLSGGIPPEGILSYEEGHTSGSFTHTQVLSEQKPPTPPESHSVSPDLEQPENSQPKQKPKTRSARPFGYVSKKTRREMQGKSGASMADKLRDLRTHASEPTETMAASEGPGRMSGGTPPPPIDPRASQAYSQAYLPDTWNRIVTSCKVDWDPDREQIKMRDVDDSRRHFEDICRKIQQIHLVRGPDAGWMTFRWLWKVKDGTPGWWKVLKGEFDWMAIAPSNGGREEKKASAEGALELLRQQTEEEERKKLESRAKRTD